MAKTLKTDAKLYKKTKTVKGTEYEYWIARQPHDGRTVECSAPTQIEALLRLGKKIEDIKSGAVGITSKMTVKRWAEEWLETYKRPVLTDKSYADYKSMIENTILPAIASLRITEVKDIHLQKILNAKADYSSSRMKKLKNRLNAMFEQARASKLILHNPAEFLVEPKTVAGTHRSITDFERKHFLAACEGHPAGLMFKVMLYCGLRTGEVAALDWRDIDFAKRRIKVSRAVESGSKKIKEPKTAAGVREVPIPDDIYKELLRLKGKPFASVFLQERGKVRHTHSSRRKAWDSLKKKIDISMGAVYEKREAKDGKQRLTKVLSVVAPDFVPYCLRHTFCTDLQKKGVPINVAKYLMGHANISVTAGIYTHMTDDVIDDAAKLICGKSCGKKIYRIVKTA